MIRCEGGFMDLEKKVLEKLAEKKSAEIEGFVSEIAKELKKSEEEIKETLKILYDKGYIVELNKKIFISEDGKQIVEKKEKTPEIPAPAPRKTVSVGGIPAIVLEQIEQALEKADEDIIRKLNEFGIESDLELAHLITWKDKKGKEHKRLTLSAYGWFEAARQYGGLKVTGGPEFEIVDDKMRCVVWVKDTNTGNEVFGVDSMIIPNKEKYQYGKLEVILSTKALRNAYKKVIPYEIKTKVLKKAEKLGLIRGVQLEFKATP